MSWPVLVGYAIKYGPGITKVVETIIKAHGTDKDKVIKELERTAKMKQLLYQAQTHEDADEILADYINRD